MTPLKPVPGGADRLKFFQEYLEACQKQLPPGSPPLNIEDMLIGNRTFGDGKWQLLYNDPKGDFFCSTEIDWLGGEMSILSGKLSKKNPKPISVLEMTDACSATKQLLGEEEFAGQTCVDAAADPKLTKGKDTATVQTFQSTCTDLMGSFTKSRYKKDFSSFFNLNRARVVNDYPKDGAFDLLFESKKYDFFCEAKVDSVEHRMILRSGSLKEKDVTAPNRALELTDACSATSLMAGADELIGDCKDRTKHERGWEHYLTVGATAAMGVMSYYAMGKLASKMWKWRSVQALRAMPVLRFAGVGYLTGKTFDSVAGQWLAKDDPVRKYGTYAAGGAGMIAPEILKATVAKKLATSSIPMRAGGFAVRFAGRALLVGLVDMGVGFMFNDYDKSVNQRVTDRVYDKWVYSLQGVKESEHWYDVLAVPLMPVRAGARWLAPNAMDFGVAHDNDDIKEEVLAEDRKACEGGLESMRDIFSLFNDEDPRVQAEFHRDVTEALTKPVELDPSLISTFTILETAGPEGLKVKGWNDEEIIAAQLKKIAYTIQTNAKFIRMVKQDTDLNNWARDVFNEDGTLKSEEKKKFLSRMDTTVPEYLKSANP